MKMNSNNGIADNKGIAANENQQDHFGPVQHENQHNHFGRNQNDVEENPIVDVNDEDGDEDDDGDNNHFIPDDFKNSRSGLYSKGNNDANAGYDDYQADHDKSNDESDTPNTAPLLPQIIKGVQLTL